MESFRSPLPGHRQPPLNFLQNCRRPRFVCCTGCALARPRCCRGCALARPSEQSERFCFAGRHPNQTTYQLSNAHPLLTPASCWRPQSLPLLVSRQDSDALHKKIQITRKLNPLRPRLYEQDHSRGRGLTTTGQPTVSSLPQNHFSFIFNGLKAGTAWKIAGQT